MSNPSVQEGGIEAANAASVSRFGNTFDQLPQADADAFLTDLGNSKAAGPCIALDAWFNDLLYRLFAQAYFADPIHGGNDNKYRTELRLTNSS